MSMFDDPFSAFLKKGQDWQLLQEFLLANPHLAATPPPPPPSQSAGKVLDAHRNADGSWNA
jgi:hypothetical protein